MHKKHLAPIPSKLFFSISEAADLCGVKPHVLRYWEDEFCQIKPTTRTGGRRYYQPQDIELIRNIRALLYDKGYTIAGARKILSSAKKLTQELSAEVVETAKEISSSVSESSLETFKQAAVASAENISHVVIEETVLALEHLLDQLNFE
ncbi:MAG: hypothetical protein A2103_01540 [Gammaproteobacteria bacterium GWF2_41_13]|nr:MAG: hypothetical protein A2103_01540 [Gammaproteobacteria bacterium GWF2_41_13]